MERDRRDVLHIAGFDGVAQISCLAGWPSNVQCQGWEKVINNYTLDQSDACLALGRGEGTTCRDNLGSLQSVQHISRLVALDDSDEGAHAARTFRML